MSKKTNPAVIGAFIIGALALLVAGLLVFGSGKFIKKADKYVSFFQGNVQGLDVGAPVSFNGVRVGTVTDVILVIDSKTLDFFIKVLYEIERGKAEGLAVPASPQTMYLALLDRGLRAKLAMQSFVTGRLYVDLQFYPDYDIKLVGMDKRYPEIPTEPTDLEKLRSTFNEALAQFRELPLKEMVEKLDHAISGVDRLVNAPEFHESVRSLRDTVEQTRRFVENLDTNATPLLANLNAATSDTRRLVNNADGQLARAIEDFGSLARSADQTLARLEATLAFEQGVPGQVASGVIAMTSATQGMMEQTRETLGNFDRTLTRDAGIQYQLNELMRELGYAARSIRVIADYLERHPESLIKGKDD